MTITTNIPNRNKQAVATLAAQIVAGIQKHFPNGGQSLTFGGGTVTLTVDAVVSSLQVLVDNRATVATAKAAVKAAVATENGKMPAQLVFLHALEAFIRLNFEASEAALGDFGLAPNKAPPPRTAEQKAIAKAKAAATRKARKAAQAVAKTVQGNVSATIVVTPNASAGVKA